MTALDTREASGRPTGASIGLYETTDATRTISDLVEDVGFLKNRTRILVADSNGVHDSAQQLHSAALDQLLRTAASQKTRESLPDLLEGLSGLGFAWRDLGRVVGVSVPAMRKWRQGESAAGDNRLRVARLTAFCDIVREQYLIDDPASWLETPIHVAAPTTGLDLIASDRFDLAFRLAGDDGADPEAILDDFDPEWRERYATSVEVFVAADGQPALRIRKD